MRSDVASHPILISQPKRGMILQLWRKYLMDKQYIISTIGKIRGIGKKKISAAVFVIEQYNT